MGFRKKLALLDKKHKSLIRELEKTNHKIIEPLRNKLREEYDSRESYLVSKENK